MRIIVSLSGCDDVTDMEMDVTEGEFAFLEKVSALSEKVSSYACMPTLEVRVVS